MVCVRWEVRMQLLIGLMLILTVPASVALTDPQDVIAMNSLFVALGYPPLPGWLLVGGDPCGDNWQGVGCVFSSITSLKLNGANLGGQLGDSLALFGSIIEIDFSNNHIGGSIPTSFPPTVRNVSLSNNQFIGSIPGGLSSSAQLLELSLDNNHLSGEIPDAFQLLTVLNRLDLSGNNLSGQLCPSLMNLSSLSTLHLQNNSLVGTLDVLQDLPLQDLNIENNLFSGPIPPKLLGIPNFRCINGPDFIPPAVESESLTWGNNPRGLLDVPHVRWDLKTPTWEADMSVPCQCCHGETRDKIEERKEEGGESSPAHATCRGVRWKLNMPRG